jgi:hypothetical protein
MRSPLGSKSLRKNLPPRLVFCLSTLLAVFLFPNSVLSTYRQVPPSISRRDRGTTRLNWRTYKGGGGMGLVLLSIGFRSFLLLRNLGW